MTETPVNTASLEEFVTQQVIDMGVPASTVKLDAKIDRWDSTPWMLLSSPRRSRSSLMIPVSPRILKTPSTLQDAVDIIREKAQEK